MPRVDVARVGFPGDKASTGQLVNWSVGDTVNGHRIRWTGKEALLVRNSGGVAYTITIDSVPDPYGREGNITAFSLAAGQTYLFGPWTQGLGWVQTDGYLNVDVNNAAVLLAVALLP